MEKDNNKIHNQTNASENDRDSKLKKSINFVKDKVNGVITSGKELVLDIKDEHKKAKDINNSINVYFG